MRKGFFGERGARRTVWKKVWICAAALLFAGLTAVANASISVGKNHGEESDYGIAAASISAHESPLHEAPVRGMPAQSEQGGGAGKDAKADSAALLQEARSAFENGDLPRAAATAAQVTSPESKAAATGIINRVSNYNAAIAAAQGAERAKDTGRAIHLYTAAANIAHNGPGDPTGHIAALRAGQAAALETQGAGTVPTTPIPTPAPAPTPMTTPTPSDQKANTATAPAPPATPRTLPTGDAQGKVSRLLAAAHGAEVSGDLPSALKAYEAVEHLQPGNAEGAAGHLRVEAAIHRDPAEQAKTLVQAIRDFYSLKYGDTEDELTSYLSSPKAQSRGAAYFYLGATRLYRRVLEGQQKPDAAIQDAAVQRSLKEAKTAGYQPVARFVSPLLMRAWQMTP